MEICAVLRSHNYISGKRHSNRELLWREPSTSGTLLTTQQLAFLEPLLVTKRRGSASFQFFRFFISFSRILLQAQMEPGVNTIVKGK